MLNLLCSSLVSKLFHSKVTFVKKFKLFWILQKLNLCISLVYIECRRRATYVKIAACVKVAVYLNQKSPSEFKGRVRLLTLFEVDKIDPPWFEVHI